MKCYFLIYALMVYYAAKRPQEVRVDDCRFHKKACQGVLASAGIASLGVVSVDGGSSDGTVEILKDYENRLLNL